MLSLTEIDRVSPSKDKEGAVARFKLPVRTVGGVGEGEEDDREVLDCRSFMEPKLLSLPEPDNVSGGGGRIFGSLLLFFRVAGEDLPILSKGESFTRPHEGYERHLCYCYFRS